MFPDTLRELRKGKKINQMALAEAFDVSQAAIAAWEGGKRQPDFETLCRIADYFGVSTDYLLGRTPMTVEVKKETPPPLGDDEMQISFLLNDAPQDENKLEEMIRRAVSEELNKRGL